MDKPVMNWSMPRCIGVKEVQVSDFQLAVLGTNQVFADDSACEPWVRPIGWRIAQSVVWIFGVVILVSLVVRPKLGLMLLWNVLIPAAPALVALAPGLWRNICPLASTALFPRHMGWSRRKQISKRWQGRLMLVGVVLLFGLIPFRHITLNTNGPASAIVLASLAVAAMLAGFFFEWKSAWCSGMCPVHQVEKLYGQDTRITMTNAHCRRCRNCVVSCSDSIPGISPMGLKRVSRSSDLAGTIMLGAFPGFVWGWFQVPSYAPGEGWNHFGQAYGYGFGAATVSLILFLMLKRFVLGAPYHPRLHRIFAAAAISFYYWYRLPWLIGLEPSHPESMLIDLSGAIPPNAVPAVRIAMGLTSAAFFMWIIAGRKTAQARWLRRPAYAKPTDPSFP